MINFINNNFLYCKDKKKIIPKILFFLILFFLIFNTTLLKIIKLQRYKNFLLKKTYQLEIETEKLKKDIKILETDDKYIENIARKKLAFYKDGETIYGFVGDKK
ncbi:MAG: septum formation initiator family protein [Elusimicrobiota bacterium]|jgi:cell division protein FtsB|nr:septum formation initiator family protein [Elusimicrobiota bacterium]